MRTIFLHGHLKEQFSDKFRFDVLTASEALRALNCAFPRKFVQAMREGAYHVIRGDIDSGLELDIKMMMELRLGSGDLHIVPSGCGAKSGGTTKAILGVAIIGAAIFFSAGTLAAPLSGLGEAAFGNALGITWGNIALLGLGVALAGVAQILSKPNQTQQQTPSYSLGGQQNVYEQGQPIPLIYGGPIIVGSQAISVGLDIEQIGAFQG
jgi:predicted phage tail protein